MPFGRYATPVLSTALRPRLVLEDGRSVILQPLFQCSLVKRAAGVGPSEAMQCLFAASISAALACFHDANRAHMDVKPANACCRDLGARSCVTLIDYASSLVLNCSIDDKEVEFTEKYALGLKPAATAAFDLACLAASVYELATSADADAPLKSVVALRTWAETEVSSSKLSAVAAAARVILACLAQSATAASVFAATAAAFPKLFHENHCSELWPGELRNPLSASLLLVSLLLIFLMYTEESAGDSKGDTKERAASANEAGLTS